MADHRFLPPLDLPVLGVPTRFLVTHEQIATQVEEAFGAWRPVNDLPGILSAGRVEVRLILRDGNHDGPAVPVRYTWPDPGRLLVETAGSHGVADLTTGDVEAYVTPELVADGAHFRHAFLSALTLASVTVFDRIPLHAAAVARGGSALLLHGPSGVGKSSLVLAGALRGVPPLSEDVVYVELGRGPRLWGMPGPVHVTQDGMRFFPGLVADRSVVRAGGVRKLAVPPPAGREARPLVARRAGICLLQASKGDPIIEAVTAGEVRGILAGTQEAGFDLFAQEAGKAAEFVTGAGAWRLHVGGSPDAAVALLADLLDEMTPDGLSSRS